MKQQKLDSKILNIKRIYRIAVPIIGTAILFCACKQNNLEKIKAFSTLEDLPTLESSNFKTLYSDSGIVRFSLEAPKLLRYENDGKAFLEFPKGIHIIKYDAQNKILSTLEADYAKQFEKEDKWEAKNNVVVTNEKGDTLKTEHLIWEEKNKKIYTDEFVKIIRENQIITGTGLTSDQDMSNWDIAHPQGVFYVKANNSPKKKETKPTKKDSISNTPKLKKDFPKPLEIK